MTPKEKAENLIKAHLTAIAEETMDSDGIIKYNAKQCALVSVDEIIKNFDGLHKPEYCAFDGIGERKFTFEGEYKEHMTGYDMVAYWEQVKAELKAMS